MGAALDNAAKLGVAQVGAVSEQDLDGAQGRFDEAADDLRKAKKPLLKASEDLATFSAALAAALLAGRLTPEQKEDAVEARAALAVPFGIRVTKFANAYRRVVEAERVLAEAEKAAAEAGDAE